MSVKACVMSAYSNTPTRTKAHSPTRDTLTAHAETNAYTVAATYSEATQSNPGRQRRECPLRKFFFFFLLIARTLADKSEEQLSIELLVE